MAKIAFIIDEMFEDSEMSVPYERVKEAGYEAVIVGLEKGKTLEGKKHKATFVTDQGVRDASADDFVALVIPGGYSPDRLRSSPDMVKFVRAFFDSGKPIAAICHAGWMLAEADVVKNRTVTSWPSIKTDLINAGASWVDREVVEDGNLVTSRKPEDLDAFCKALLKQIERGSARRLSGNGKAPPTPEMQR